MNLIWQIVLFVALLMIAESPGQSRPARGYLGFDRNDYPGDAAMRELRKEFSFTGYWLTPPPEEKRNSWTGRRRALESQGYGFLLLARGRAPSKIHDAATAQQAGTGDAREAARGATAEGFAAGAIIFLDIEDGGRLGGTYHAYLKAWADELTKSGFRPGVYCSGIAVDEGQGVTVVTAEDIRANEAPRDIAYWVFNDACPPSPGCVSLDIPPPPSASGMQDATAWQFVRSPRDKQTASRCAGFARDENCYGAADAAKKWFLDMDIAARPNPSFVP